MVEAVLNTARNVLCPSCLRKICKIRVFNLGKMVEVKHKRSLVIAPEVIVGCVDCKRTYRVNANEGKIEEVDLGN